MCELCDNEPGVAEHARKRHLFLADEFHRMEVLMRDVAAGRVKPHTDEFCRHQHLAHGLLRYIVEAWL